MFVNHASDKTLTSKWYKTSFKLVCKDPLITSWKDISQTSQAPRPVAHTVSALKAALWVLAIPTLSTLKRGQCLSGSA